jgi:hypothetical protein
MGPEGWPTSGIVLICLAPQEEPAMTVARRLAEFLTETTVGDLPTQALDHAAMVIASTLASAACGTRIESARIVRDLAGARGGRPDASVWFDPALRLPATPRPGGGPPTPRRSMRCSATPPLPTTAICAISCMPERR